jgi:hypothetical protein
MIEILDDTGTAVKTSASWQEPRGGHYFGWLTADGFCTVRIEHVQAISPSAHRRDQYVVLMLHGVALTIGDQDALRLMKRLGWVEPGGKKVNERTN